MIRGAAPAGGLASGIAVGLNKGFPVEKRNGDLRKNRPAARKGTASKRNTMIRDLGREVVGLKPYEKRILEMLKTGGATCEKRIYKFAKQRLGTHVRAIKKREIVKDIHAKMRNA